MSKLTPARTKGRSTRFRLTLDNYYAKERPHISNSMLSTYKHSPDLYKRRYLDQDPTTFITRTREMKLGSLVDDLITRGHTDYVANPFDFRKERKEYLAFKKCHDDDKIIPLELYETALEIVEFVKAQPFFQDPADFQVVLQGTLERRRICGLADWIMKDRSKLIDLKVVSTHIKTESPSRWNHHAWDMGYYRQFALYEYMLGQSIDCYWVVAHNAGYGVVDVKIYKADPRLKAEALEEARQLMKGIKAKRFSKPIITWDNVIDLGYESTHR